jgi:methyl-coenzyme M reductase alpha subunit
MPGAAVVQEHMVETSPALTEDCYVKVYTGDDEMADSLEPQFLIDINKQFPAKQAEQIKAAIGKSMYQAVHIPTIVSRTCDGGTASRWSAMQLGMSYIGAYRMCAGEAATADLAFAAKHAGLIEMANLLPARRARGPNEPGGLKFGLFSDIVQTDRKYPNDPVKSSLEVVAAGTMLFDQIWLGSYMSGGVGFTQYATAAYTDNVLDDFCYYGQDYVKDKFKGWTKAPQKQEVVNDIATEVTLYGMEQYEQYPSLLEDHFGGSQRASVLAAASGLTCSMATANSNAGLNGWYLSMLVHKEGWSRLGFYGYDLQDQCGSANCMAIRSDEGLITELRGANYPNYAMNVGHQGEVLRSQDQGLLRRPRPALQLRRATQGVCPGSHPRVHASRRALADHPGPEVTPTQPFFSVANRRGHPFRIRQPHQGAAIIPETSGPVRGKGG